MPTEEIAAVFGKGVGDPPSLSGAGHRDRRHLRAVHAASTSRAATSPRHSPRLRASCLVPAPSRGGLRALRVDARARSTPRVRATRRHRAKKQQRIARWGRRVCHSAARAPSASSHPVRSRPTVQRTPLRYAATRYALGTMPRSRRVAAQASRCRAQRGSRWANPTAHTGAEKQNDEAQAITARTIGPTPEKRGMKVFSAACPSSALHPWCPQTFPLASVGSLMTRLRRAPRRALAPRERIPCSLSHTDTVLR